MRFLARLPVLAIALTFGLAACGDRGPVAPTSPDAVPITRSVVPDGVEACGDPLEVELLAGQDIDVGSVTVANDEDDLYVTYVTEDGWTLRATHLEVTTSVADVPATQTGNPIVGRFSHQKTHDGITRFSYAIALSDLGVEPGDDLVVVAQADVYNAGLVQSETAWGSGSPFLETNGNWATYAGYSVQDCVVLVESSISGGANHSCALSTAGDAYCWGFGGLGQLGVGFASSSLEPAAVTMPSGVTFTNIEAGSQFTVALASNGDVYAWGLNAKGQLGDGTTTDRFSPTPISTPTGVSFTDIAVGIDYTLAISTTGDAYGWGGNRNGQLGDGTTTDRLTPAPTSMPGDVSFVEISAGGFTSLALAAAGDAYGWGSNFAGQVGDGTTSRRLTPVAVRMPAGTEFTTVSAGSGYSLALTSTGDAYAWGANSWGNLGDGTKTHRLTPAPTTMPAGVTFTDIEAGRGLSLAISSTGDGYGWGNNSAGQLGDGTTTDRRTPTPISMPSGVSFVRIAGGTSHSLAVSRAGAGFGWGFNGIGQVGDGTTTNRLTPVAVTMPAGVSFE